MLGSQAALLLALSLLTQGRLQAAPLPPAPAPPPASPAPPAADSAEQLFGGAAPRAVAAALLEALGEGAHESPDKRDSPQARLAELRPGARGAPRRAPPAEPWAGALQLRRQQRLEHQLLQRRYEELAESRRQAEEARKAAAAEERLADLAADLLLRYLLQGAPGELEREREEEEEAGASPLLFEDEEAAAEGAQDKRSEEEEEEETDEDWLDPSTVDQLIDLSTKLRLPAGDVADIISGVQKRKKQQQAAAPPRAPRRGSPQAQRAWNEVLRAAQRPAPAPRPRADFPNALAPLLPPRGRPPPAPREPSSREEELGNWVERVLMDRAQGFA
ncbi:neurosecretory protein VGF [Carettochelys insculpta]|uniref:neurosecretory protein VGF n=1 Tax=Carettochelys insculpta TaxID=44489 RepID=UPI003EBA3E51